MIRRDYLQNQIDQLGKALGQVLADFLGLKAKGKVSEGVEIVDQTLRHELHLDLAALTNIPLDDFLTILIEQKQLNQQHLATLADLLYHTAESKEASHEDTRKRYQKALAIYEYLSETESVYSFERHLKMEKIKAVLS